MIVVILKNLQKAENRLPVFGTHVKPTTFRQALNYTTDYTLEREE
ncbi:hypothetical protein [Sutcliffiella horikoshii]|nr:hypothetical protein [Sutcliffiella horikoshii]